MKVYVVTAEPYHDNSSIQGVYASLEAAKNSVPAMWANSGPYVLRDKNIVAESIVDADDYCYLIHEYEVE